MATSELRIRVLGEDRASGPLGGVLRSVQGIATVAGGMLTAGLFQNLGRQVAAMGREALQATADYELLAMSLQSLAARELRNTDTTLTMGEAMALSADRAEELLNWTTQLALKSPFDQAGVAEAFRTALAYGFTTDQAQRLTRATIDMATATGASTQQMNQIALALGQVQAKGRLQGQEILQLVNAGIPALQMLANYYGITTAEAQKMVEQGLVPANEAFEAIVGTLEDDFAGAAERSSESWAGLMNAFEDLKAMGLRALFEGILEALQPVVAAFAEWLQGPGLELLADWGRKIGEFAEDVITLARYLGEAAVNGELVDKWLEELPGWLQPAAREIGEFLAQAQPLIDFLLTWAGLKTPAAPPSEMPGWENFEPEMQQALMDDWEAGQPADSLSEALEMVVPQEVIDSWDRLRTAVGLFVDVVTGEPGVDGANGKLIDLFGGSVTLAASLDELARVLGTVTGWIQQIKDRAAEKTDPTGLQLVIDKLREMWTQVELTWNKVKTAFTGGYNAVATTLTNLKTQITSTFLSIRTTATTIFQQVKEAIQTKVDEAKAAVTGVFEDIRSFLDGQADVFRSAGANLMEGLKGGILGKVGDLINAVRGAVRSVIGAGNEEAGISSPSKVFAEMGRQMAAGMTLGITQGAGGPAAAMRAAIGGAAGVTLPAGAGRGGSIDITINVNGIQDPAAVVRYMKRELGRELRPLLAGGL